MPTPDNSASWEEDVGSRIGVLICNCQGQVGKHIDTAGLARAAAAWDGVAFAACTDLLCSNQELAEAVDRLKKERCEKLLVGGCSPRSSLKFPEERLARAMAEGGLDPAFLELANVWDLCKPRPWCSIMGSGPSPRPR